MAGSDGPDTDRLPGTSPARAAASGPIMYVTTASPFAAASSWAAVAASTPTSSGQARPAANAAATGAAAEDWPSAVMHTARSDPIAPRIHRATSSEKVSMSPAAPIRSTS
ncbi:MAG: hypothetical protein E6G43_12230 [Actinobacteria bacterium]|nr:MAG: hypothetical protein E6G43_12230 [Actinomycetota bacterium]